MKTFLILAKKSQIEQKLNFSRSALFHIQTRVSLKYFVNGCSLARLGIIFVFLILEEL